MQKLPILWILIAVLALPESLIAHHWNLDVDQKRSQSGHPGPTPDPCGRGGKGRT